MSGKGASGSETKKPNDPQVSKEESAPEDKEPKEATSEPEKKDLDKVEASTSSYRDMTNNNNRFDVSKLNITPFNGEGYSIWKWKLENLWEHLGLTKVIDGTATSIEDKDKTLCNMIFCQTLSDSQLLHIMHLKSPKEKWDRLTEIHDNSSADRKQQLLSTFFSLKMDDEEGMADFLSKVNAIKVKLEGLNESLSDATVIATVLSKLPSRFNLFVESWNQSTDSNKTLAVLESRLLRAEERLKALVPPSRSQVLMTTGGRLKGSKGSETSKCSKFNGECFFCKKRGHRKQDCRSFLSQSKNTRSKEDDGGSSACIMASGASLIGSGGNKLTWLADSGASRHMSPIKDWFNDYEEVLETVFTANGQPVACHGKGTIRVNSCGRPLDIQGVLHVPSLTHSLLSLSTVVERGHEVSLKNGKLTMVNGSGTLIAKGELKINSRMFTMDFSPMTQVNLVRNGQPSLTLWH